MADSGDQTREERQAARAERQEERAQRQASRQALQSDPNEQAKAQSFVQQYTQGDPTGGQPPQQALQYLRMVHDEASPQEMQTAIHQTLQNLPPEQKATLANLVQQHQGQAPASAGGIEGVLSGLAHSVTSNPSNTAMLGGLVSSLLGSSGQAAPAQQGTGSDVVSSLLGSVLGHGQAAAPQGGQGNVVDSLLGSVLGGGSQASGAQAGGNDALTPLLKTVLGGVAAYGVQQMMNKQQ